MQKNRKFVNPLTRSTEQASGEQPSSTDTATDTSTFTSTGTDTNTETFTDTPLPEQEQPYKRKEQTFEQVNERITLWVNKRLKRRFEALANRERVPKTVLLNEAITDLLEKYQNK